MASDPPDDLKHDHISNYEVSDDYAAKYLKRPTVPDDMMDAAIEAFVEEVDALAKAGHWSKDRSQSVQRVVAGNVRIRIDLGAWVDKPPRPIRPHGSPWFPDREGGKDDDA